MTGQYEQYETMETLGDTVKRLRKGKGISQKQLANKSGLGTSYISRLEANKGPKSITIFTATALAFGLGMRTEDLIKEVPLADTRAPYAPEAPESRTLKDVLRVLGERFQAEATVRVAILGLVPAGKPCMQSEITGEYLDLPESYVSGIPKPYALRISGDSLEDMGIRDGDIVIVERDAEYIEGKTFVVRIGTECTVKRVHRQDDRLLLVGANGILDIRDPNEVINLGRVRMVFKPPREV